MSWSPWGARERPTADSVTDDQMDDLLGRLERAEEVTRILTRWAYPTSSDQAEELKSALFFAFRDVLHGQHGGRFAASRGAERCRTCIHRAHHLVCVWEPTQEWEQVATETRLREIQDRVTQAPMTSWGSPESAWRSREDVPWLLSQVRLAQRAVRRMQARENREDKDARRRDQRAMDLKIENKGLRTSNEGLKAANERLARELADLKAAEN